MDISLESLPNDKRFEVKLQIELYRLAERVMTAEKSADFEAYMNERKDKLRKILGIKNGRIYEGDELLITL